MSWADLLQEEGEVVTSPWTGGRSVRLGDRTWRLEGKLPKELGWATFKTAARTCTFEALAEANPDLLRHVITGYLVGDRFVSDKDGAFTDLSASETVYLIELGLPRFSRISAGRMFPDGPLIFKSQEFPLGPEPDVAQAFLDRKISLEHVKGVAPALEAAFRLELWQRVEVQRLRGLAEKQRREEEEQRKKEELRKELVTKLGDGESRRRMALVDFEAAAKAALAVGGATYLDHRPSTNKGEMVVQFQLEHRGFECVCNSKTMQVVDSGICLVSHGERGFDRGYKGDTLFTLESLPSVIRQAIREHKLVVYRHIGGANDDDRWDDE